MGKLPQSDLDWLLDTLKRTPNIVRIVTLIDILPEAAPTILETPIDRRTLTNNPVVDNTPVAQSSAIVTPIALEP